MARKKSRQVCINRGTGNYLQIGCFMPQLAIWSSDIDLEPTKLRQMISSTEQDGAFTPRVVWTLRMLNMSRCLDGIDGTLACVWQESIVCIFFCVEPCTCTWGNCKSWSGKVFYKFFIQISLHSYRTSCKRKHHKNVTRLHTRFVIQDFLICPDPSASIQWRHHAVSWSFT
jgi:hypothetical protein